MSRVDWWLIYIIMVSDPTAKFIDYSINEFSDPITTALVKLAKYLSS